MSTTLYNQNALAARARSLGTLNGIDFALMQLPASPPTPQSAVLEVHFYNDQHLADLATAATTPSAIWSLLPIQGGERMLAGPLTGQVQVTQVAHSTTNVLQLTLAPVGDYSRYTLSIQQPGFDPIFSQFVFRFRPGCFQSNCFPLTMNVPAVVEPVIDYLAKDYDSFRHTMIAAMMQRVANWQPTSEAAFDVVLLDLFSAAADELSNYQDRVMQEAYWVTSQKRISLRRHARLMDYFIHEGNQANTLLAINVAADVSFSTPAFIVAWTGVNPPQPNAVWFLGSAPTNLFQALSAISLYTWSDAIPALAAGATQADLAFSSHADALAMQTQIQSGQITQLLIEEWLNPLTGRAADRDPQKRQLLQLTDVAELLTDPLTNDPVLRVHWREQDMLTANYCFVVTVNGVRVPNVSLFHGNLVSMVQGRTQFATYDAPGTPLAPGTFAYRRLSNGAAVCHLSPAFPVLWTKTTPGGYQSSVSTLTVSVQDSSGVKSWTEQPDLIHSESTDTHFVVETDEHLRTLVRFGDGTNGSTLTEDAVVTCSWLTGHGEDGNIGKDTLVNFGTLPNPILPAMLVQTPQPIAQATCWNPFDVTDGLAPETRETILRRVPEAYRYQQDRAVTLGDYAACAQQVPGVARAAAFYMWTGSWRTVRVCIDPEGTTTLSDTLRATVEQQLDAVHLIGEDVEVRAPKYVPLTLAISVCIASDYWMDAVLPVIEQAFSNGYNDDGTMAFFHPDRWIFGQALYASEIEGVLQKITGVKHVISIQMTRWWDQAVTSTEVMTMAPDEIVLVSNDPSRMEDGLITFALQGGRG